MPKIGHRIGHGTHAFEHRIGGRFHDALLHALGARLVRRDAGHVAVERAVAAELNAEQPSWFAAVHEIEDLVHAGSQLLPVIDSLVPGIFHLPHSVVGRNTNDAECFLFDDAVIHGLFSLHG